MMWSLWQKAKTYSQLPSKVFGEEDGFAAWMLDEAVTWFGVTIENALQERVKVGSESQPKYTLARLLSQQFRLPAPPREVEPKGIQASPWAPLLEWVGKKGSGVGRAIYVGPSQEGKQH